MDDYNLIKYVVLVGLIGIGLLVFSLGFKISSIESKINKMQNDMVDEIHSEISKIVKKELLTYMAEKQIKGERVTYKPTKVTSPTKPCTPTRYGYCPLCDTLVSSSEHFCNHCGAAIGWDELCEEDGKKGDQNYE